MAKARGGEGTPALRVLSPAGVPHKLRGYVLDPATTSYGLEAAQALGVDPARVLKTLVVQPQGQSPPAVAVVPVDRQLDQKATAAALHVKGVQLAARALVERATGYVVGGISPIGQRQRLRTVIDDSAARLDPMLVSAGRRGLDVVLAPAHLVAVTGAVVAPVAR